MASGLAACGGGGGGGSTTPPGSTPTPPSGGHTPTPPPGGGTPTPPPGGATPTPVPTPTPTGHAYSLPAPTGTALTLYAAGSNPAGLTVKVNTTSVGVTPATPGALAIPAAAIPYAASSYAITIVPSSTAAPYTVMVGQYGSAPNAPARTIFYNQVLDTSGSISNLAALSIRRQPAAVREVQAPPSFSVARAPQRMTVSGFAHAPESHRSRASIAGRPLYSSSRIAVSYDAASFGSNRTFSSIEAAHGAARAVTLSQRNGRVSRVVTLAPGQSVASALRAFRSEPGVVAVDRVRMRYPLAYSGTFYPNDPFFSISTSAAQWYLYQIDSEDAWAYGAGTAPIAVIDTGYDPKQTEVASQVTFSEKVVGGDVYAFPGAATDTDGHGTFLSGVLGAATNNNAGFAGAAYNAPLQEFKIAADAPSASVSADTADEAQAIYDAISNHARVILIAFGGDASAGPDPTELTAVQAAIQAGVVVVAGSGDDGATATALDFPAGYSGVISVGASAYNDTASPPVEFVPSYSNAGPGLGIVAPGGQGTGADNDLYHWITNVYTTQPYTGNSACTTPATPATCAILYTGTSPAAALVAGTVSLMLTQNGSLSPANVAQMLYNTTQNINDPKQGHGRLNAYQAVTMAAGGPPPTPGPSATPNPMPPPAFNPPSGTSFVAFAYTSNGDIPVPYLPPVLDMTYTRGVPVNADGTFRLADFSPSTMVNNGNYRIGVWLDLNGDGVISPGDYFGSVGCNGVTKPCTAKVTVNLVTSNTQI